MSGVMSGIKEEVAAYRSTGMINTSGLSPVEYKILIEPEEVEQKSAGGIVLAIATTEKEKMAQVRGRLIAVGGNAFEDWNEPIPRVGDKVYYAKYAGKWIKDHRDGQEYLVVNDEDIVAKYEDVENDSPVVATEQA